MKDLIVTAYIIYLPIAIILTLLVARIFFKNSLIFMVDIFRGRKEMADSTNHLFKVGFYLMTLGFALSIMKIYERGVSQHKDVFEILSTKVGILSVFLGIMVFFNLYLLFRGKKRTSEKRMQQQMFNQAQVDTGVSQ